MVMREVVPAIPVAILASNNLAFRQDIQANNNNNNTKATLDNRHLKPITRHSRANIHNTILNNNRARL
jgi:hypothetical protein